MSKKWVWLIIVAVAVAGAAVGLLVGKQAERRRAELAAELIALLGEKTGRSEPSVLCDKEGHPVALIQEAVAAQSFILVDDKDRECAHLSTATGTPALVLYDEQQQGGVTLGVIGPGQPTLVFFDAQHTPRVVLRLVEEGSMLAAVDGNPALQLHDAEGRLRAVIGLVEGEPHCTFYNSKREVVGTWEGGKMTLEGEE